MKISVFGYSGSGKSTLAKALSKVYEIPVLHLDSVHFLPGWKERSVEEMSAIVGKFLDENTSWVIDGSYKRNCFERRMAESDMLVFLDFNRFTCFFRAWKRYRQNKGKARADMAEGCNERFHGEFIRWLLWDGRTRKRRQAFQKVVAMYASKTIILKNQRQLTAFLKAQEAQAAKRTQAQEKE